jgi:hypothetical protein
MLEDRHFGDVLPYAPEDTEYAVDDSNYDD